MVSIIPAFLNDKNKMADLTNAYSYGSDLSLTLLKTKKKGSC